MDILFTLCRQKPCHRLKKVEIDVFIQNLKLIKEKKIFMKEHMVIVHRDRKAKDNYENLIEIIETKKYGRSKIIFGIFI